jgi:hypothetical protein
MRSQQRKTAAWEGLQICRKLYPWRVVNWKEVIRFGAMFQTLDGLCSIWGLERKVLADGDPLGTISLLDGKTYETDVSLRERCRLAVSITD